MDDNATDKYAFGFEIGGPLGLFADPATGSEPTSYPLPPPTAVRGMIDSIGKIKGAVPVVVAIGLVSLPAYTEYGFNSGSPLRKRNTVYDGTMCQIRATALFRPRFCVLAVIRNSHRHRHEKYAHVNAAHALQCMLFRRLKNEQCFRNICLGWKEMTADYCGPIISKVKKGFSTTIPALVKQITDEDAVMARQTITNAEIKGGVLHLEPDVPIEVDDGKLTFADQRLKDILQQMPTR